MATNEQPTDYHQFRGTGSLTLTDDPISLTAALVDIYSESHNEQVIADVLETALREIPEVEVVRQGHVGSLPGMTNVSKPKMEV